MTFDSTKEFSILLSFAVTAVCVAIVSDQITKRRHAKVANNAKMNTLFSNLFMAIKSNEEYDVEFWDIAARFDS